ncbi:T6SS immunity protein Tdi1 domain-containing protein [Enterococcus ureasiticus]|uniref:T6SS immunity protein Tdi1 domain-containing protein n=1 Tax=Enterococcus ureasiticus TaxID=903984 RepID=UPI000A01849F
MNREDFFFDYLEDTDFIEENLKWSPYPKATKMLGTPACDECFHYVPILGVSGSEKVTLIEHLLIIINFRGPIA